MVFPFFEDRRDVRTVTLGKHFTGKRRAYRRNDIRVLEPLPQEIDVWRGPIAQDMELTPVQRDFTHDPRSHIAVIDRVMNGQNGAHRSAAERFFGKKRRKHMTVSEKYFGRLAQKKRQKRRMPVIAMYQIIVLPADPLYRDVGSYRLTKKGKPCRAVDLFIRFIFV